MQPKLAAARKARAIAKIATNLRNMGGLLGCSDERLEHLTDVRAFSNEAREVLVLEKLASLTNDCDSALASAGVKRSKGGPPWSFVVAQEEAAAKTEADRIAAQDAEAAALAAPPEPETPPESPKKPAKKRVAKKKKSAKKR